MFSVLLALVGCSGCAPDQPERPKGKKNTSERPDIVLVVVDSLRPDHLGLYGYDRPTSPNLDAWAAEAVVFHDVSAHATWTRPAMASLLTGQLPATHGLHTATDTPAATGPALHQLLASRDGYAAAAVVASAVLNPRANPFMRGFDPLDHSVAGSDRDPLRRPTAESITDRALTVWTEHHRTSPDTPLFLLVHYADPHGPWVTHPDHPFGETPTDRYDSEIAGVDAAFGRLAKALGDEPVVIFTADHGTSLGEHGPAGNGGPPHEEAVRIPLIVRAPGRLLASQPKKSLAQIDIAPGILRTAALKRSKGLPGTGWKLDAFGDVDYGRRDVLFDTRGKSDSRGVRDGRYKLIEDRKTAALALYDLKEDPGESTNLAELPEHAERLAELKAKLP